MEKVKNDYDNIIVGEIKDENIYKINGTGY